MATDFQAIVDGIAAMTCVVSVERLDDGACGAIRIVTGNRAYLDSIEKPAPGTEMLERTFVPNTEYTRYLNRDLNFEDFCYRAAVEKKCLHSYAHPERMNVWFNMTFLPLDADDGNLSYCTYTMEIGFEASSERLSNVPGEVASRVLEMAIKLRGSNDFRTTMDDVIRDIRMLCKTEYCCILLVDEQARTCETLCEDAEEGSALLPMDHYLDDAFYEIVETWPDTIAGSNCLIAKNAHDMKVVEQRNPRWRESLASASIENIALFPLESHGHLLGYIWAVNFDAERSTKIKEALELTTYVLAAEIDNHLLLDKLKVLSSRDMLTGVLNRNEMNEYVQRLSTWEGQSASVGVVFADLNGLKTVNDNEGHGAGDRLLKDGVLALEAVFDSHDIFRAGGDEFVAIVLDATEESLAQQVAAVRAAAKRYDNVSFAIGSAVAANCADVRRALQIADERMYEDKRRYYELHPKDARTPKDNDRV